MNTLGDPHGVQREIQAKKSLPLSVVCQVSVKPWSFTEVILE